MEDLKSVIEVNPSLLIIGTGSSEMMKVPEDLVRKLSKSMKVVVEDTGSAVDRYNSLESDGVVACLHLTC